jgi:hypothetical protein
MLETKAIKTALYCSAYIYISVCLYYQKGYTGQTGRHLLVIYKEHICNIRLNKEHSEFNLQVFNGKHVCGTIDQALSKIDHAENEQIMSIKDGLHISLHKTLDK